MLIGGAFIEVFLLHSTGWVFLRFLAETFIEADMKNVVIGIVGISLPILEGLSLRRDAQLRVHSRDSHVRA